MTVSADDNHVFLFSNEFPNDVPLVFENLAGIDVKLEMLEQQLSDASLVSDQKKYQQVVREHSHVSKLTKDVINFRS